MCLPLPSPFKVQLLFQLTKNVVRLLLFALCPAFFSRAGLRLSKTFLVRIAINSLIYAICKHIKRKMGTVTATALCAAYNETDTRDSMR